MHRIKFLIALFFLFGLSLATFLVLRSDIALVTHPKGIIAREELHLIKTHLLLMLIIIGPTLAFLCFTFRRCSAKKGNPNYKPGHNLERSLSKFEASILWVVPTVLIAVMAFVTWHTTHKLDPYQPLQSTQKPLTIQVMALDWKWLFIYPEQGIATVNFVQFPADTPIHFLLSADGSPMNSFWIPQLSGQIYAMTGMTTSLHLAADGPGTYTGRAAEINGKGYADMTFVVKSTYASDFATFISDAKQSPLLLTEASYQELVKPSINHPMTLYSYVEPNFFDRVVMSYMHPPHL